jgi:hypothetical protein
MAPRTTAFPTAIDSFPGVADVGNQSPVNAVAQAVVALETLRGIQTATASTNITMATAVTISLASGSIRTISTVNLAGGATITISAVGATQGSTMEIYKIATGSTGIVTLCGHNFTTKKKFSAVCKYINGSWVLGSIWQGA